jgi:hypothetical protein
MRPRRLVQLHFANVDRGNDEAEANERLSAQTRP